MSSPSRPQDGETLSSLRLSHALLLEKHGSTTALLRQREVELADAQAHEVELLEFIDKVDEEKKQWRERCERKERERGLLEREVGFLGALVVSFRPY